MEISGLALSIAPDVIPTNTDELGMWLELGFSWRNKSAVNLFPLSSFHDRFTVLQYEWEFKVCMYVCTLGYISHDCHMTTIYHHMTCTGLQHEWRWEHADLW